MKAIEVEDTDEDEDEEKTYSDLYCDETETRYFSEDEIMSEYMVRLFSNESDEKAIEDAIENGDEIENETEIITPIDANTAVVEDKESGEYSKATLNDDDIDVIPISEDEAEDLMEDVEVEDEDEDEDEEECRSEIERAALYLQGKSVVTSSGFCY